ncbi:hypothetical protein EV421DRAFT_1743136 [Armillaria borealis]|uniref:Uncharacterized protein n=1 Tax=Armillaria borealis TaxID=47425 RepID=A0AA39MFD4_9AGAR|nr:hypothetical protein EV421DRAFT_1743136 [Armillaria borealis]
MGAPWVQPPSPFYLSHSHIEGIGRSVEALEIRRKWCSLGRHLELRRARDSLPIRPLKSCVSIQDNLMQLQYGFGPLLMTILWPYTMRTNLQFVNPSAGGFSVTGSRATITEAYCSPIRNVEGLPAIYLPGLYKNEDRVPTARVS